MNPSSYKRIARPIRPLLPYLETISHSSKRMLPYWIAAALTGLVSVAFAKVFSLSEEFAIDWLTNAPYLAFVITPIVLVLSSGLTLLVAPLASGSGIPQLLAAIEVSRNPHPLIDKLIGARIIITKILGTCLTVIGGGVSGREGPMLQISAGVFNLVRRFWPNAAVKPNLQSMILAGGAAGLASAFNTPLGGVIFAIEELAKVHIGTIRTYVFHAVIIAGLLAQAALGNYLYFGKIAVNPVNPKEYIPLIIAAAIIGMCGGVFGKVTVMLLDFRARRSLSGKLTMSALLGLVVATILYFYGLQAMGSGRAVIIDILAHSDQAPPLTLGLIRGIGNLLTYATGCVGGVFAPALSTGAALGAWAGGFASENNHHVWTLVGMVAFLTGVTRSPFTSFILVLEMTDTQASTVHLMLGAVAANSAAKLIDPVSFYEHVSHRILLAAGVIVKHEEEPESST